MSRFRLFLARYSARTVFAAKGGIPNIFCEPRGRRASQLIIPTQNPCLLSDLNGLFARSSQSIGTEASSGLGCSRPQRSLSLFDHSNTFRQSRSCPTNRKALASVAVRHGRIFLWFEADHTWTLLAFVVDLPHLSLTIFLRRECMSQQPPEHQQDTSPNPPPFRLELPLHQLLYERPVTKLPKGPASPAQAQTLPEPVFPQHPDLLRDPAEDHKPHVPPERRRWKANLHLRTARGWLVPYLRSRLLPGDFHPITSYLFLEYKCNLDCHYCWSFDNSVRGMTEDVARRSIDWLHDVGCRVVGLMGGEPLLRPAFAHKVTYYAAKKGFWIYLGTNGRLLRPELTDRLTDAGLAVVNFALDAVDEKPGLPKALTPVRRNLNYLLNKQYRHGHLVFFNMNICRTNLEDMKQLTEFAHDNGLVVDFHINETPMLEQGHFQHYDNNSTYIQPEDWPRVDD